MGSISALWALQRSGRHLSARGSIRLINDGARNDRGQARGRWQWGRARLNFLLRSLPSYMCNMPM